MIRSALNKFMVVVVLLALTACGEYQKVLKSADMDYKYAKAVEYYEEGKYNNALALFDELLNLYRGTLKAQDVYYYYSSTLYELKDYILAGYHFKTFVQTFPSNPRVEESSFMVAKCYYLEAPAYSLDQAYTYKAMNELQLFINRYPESEKLIECNVMIDELRGKLERKSYEIAYQYYKTRRYQASVVAFNNTLNDFPDTPYREMAMYYRFRATFDLAENSIEEKKRERFREARTAYLDFITAYPESEYRDNAAGLFETIEEFLNDKSLS